jgi:hypothetical protein
MKVFCEAPQPGPKIVAAHFPQVANLAGNEKKSAIPRRYSRPHRQIDSLANVA